MLLQVLNDTFGNNALLMNGLVQGVKVNITQHQCTNWQSFLISFLFLVWQVFVTVTYRICLVCNIVVASNAGLLGYASRVDAEYQTQAKYDLIFQTPLLQNFVWCFYTDQITCWTLLWPTIRLFQSVNQSLQRNRKKLFVNLYFFQFIPCIT